ncbi:hypothetical protein [Aquimarina longa]|uniref:hypothetical protein n=1 Tax=Aquimarina longa TaxID=1080221 RepID=UPI00130D68F7|nr:hypothetical protein [Aquimarina longa]
MKTNVYSDKKHFKSSSKKIVAQAYSVNDKTLNKWLEPHKKAIGVYRSRFGLAR